jgi:hypothetical protein
MPPQSDYSFETLRVSSDPSLHRYVFSSTSPTGEQIVQDFGLGRTSSGTTPVQELFAQTSTTSQSTPSAISHEELSKALSQTYYPEISHLHYFARNGDLQGLQRVAASMAGDGLQYENAPRDSQKRCPMFVAVEHGQLACAQFLFDLFSPECLLTTTSENENLCMAACAKGNHEMLQWLYSVTRNKPALLSLWAGYNKRSRATCLSLACASGNLHCAELVSQVLSGLHRFDNYVSLPNSRQKTPFQVALDQPQFPMCWFLLLRGGLTKRPLAQLDNEADRSIVKSFAKTIAFTSPFDYPSSAKQSFCTNFDAYFEFLRCSVREGCVVRGAPTDVLQYIGTFLDMDIKAKRSAAREVVKVLSAKAR